MISALSGDKGAIATYNTIQKKYRGLKVCFIYANVENVQVAYSSGEIMKEILGDVYSTMGGEIRKIKTVNYSEG